MSEMRVCKKCQQEKAIGDFRLKKKWRSWECKRCSYDSQKKWCLDNREKWLNSRRLYRLSNSEKFREWEKASRIRNPSKINECKKKWAENNLERAYEIKRRWYFLHKEEVTKKERERRRVCVSKLSDSYVKGLLGKHGDLKIPSDLVEVKRLQVQIHRLLKEK